jgi:hypothetical protein
MVLASGLATEPCVWPAGAAERGCTATALMSLKVKRRRTGRSGFGRTAPTRCGYSAALVDSDVPKHVPGPTLPQSDNVAAPFPCRRS